MKNPFDEESPVSTPSAKTMKPAPETIGGARVLRWTTIDGRLRPTGNCRHIVGGEVWAGAAGLAICRHVGEEAVYLYSCDASWTSIADTWHSTLGEALEQAEFEYAGVGLTWASRG